MNDLISREIALKVFEDYIGLTNKSEDARHKIISILKSLPSAETETTKVEKQEKVYESSDHMFVYETWGECGNCGEPVKQGANYCSWCGMKLDWDKDGDE